MEKLRHLVIKHKVDILNLTELNTNWSKVQNKETIWRCINKWREQGHTNASHNKKESTPTVQQYGGTAVSLFNKAAIRKHATGTDPRSLGRWSWTRLRGKADTVTVIISAYCPCVSYGPHSVYSQHLREMQEITLPPTVNNPRKFFWHDLSEFIKEQTQQGFRIILTGDFNSEHTHVTEWMLEHGLVDLICEKHGYEHAPRTHTKSKNSPIDGIYGSPLFSIRQGGYLSFNKLGGDHRGLWIDIPEILLFGFNPPTPSLAHARRLKLQDPRVVNKYNELLHDFLGKNKVYQRMSVIHSQTVYPLPPHLQMEYEVCDTLIQKGMTRAEKKCRKFKCGNTAWSPTFQRIHDKIDYWSLRLKYSLGQVSSVSRLKRLQKKLDIEYIHCTIEQLKTALSSAHQERKNFKARAQSESLEYRNQLANAKAEDGKKSAAQHLRDLNNIEDVRRLFNTIKAVEGKLKTGSTTQVQVTQANGSKIMYTTQKEIEKLIIDTNEKKYHQTEGCSQLLTQAAIEVFGHFGEKDETENILNGISPIPPNFDSHTKDFVSECLLDPVIQPIPTSNDPVIRFKNFVKGWQIRKENTSTYNQHIGHYKAGIQHDYIGWCLFQRHEIPAISGYSPIRHRKCIDLSILKRSGNHDIKKQRTLGILDTEFNQLNSELGRSGMKNAIEHNLIATEQYSRPRRSAIEHAMNRILTFDHFKYIRKPFCIASCDLAGCYDRIIHIAAFLALRKVGVPRARLVSMFSTIQRMIHRIRTTYGDSNQTYGGDSKESWTNFAQGILQGNASGPQVWSILSSVIFRILHKRGHSTSFCKCISKSLFELLGFSYVDDCDLIQSKDTPETTVTAMQDLVNDWCNYMKVTGGKVEATKSWWYNADVSWVRDKWKITDATDNTPLTITFQNRTQELPKLKVDEASEMLGIWMTLNGNHTVMKQHLRKETLKWASKMQLGRPSREVAWTALHTTISEKMKYSLPIARFTQKECDYIMAPAIATGLSCSGVNRYFPKAARHAPITSGGLHVLNLFHEMGISRTTLLVEHCFNKTPTGAFLQLNVEHLSLEAGLYGLIWSMDIDMISCWCDTTTWIFHTISYNSKNKIELNIPHSHLQAQRHNDKALMELAYNYTRQQKKLRSINKVRMLHEIVHLSDITTANGQYLEPLFLLNDPIPDSRNEYIWPAKHHVTNEDFNIWRQFITSIFSSINNSLPRALTYWTTSERLQDRISWHWFISYNHSILYERVNDSFAVHQIIRRNQFNYDCTFIPHLPENAQQASVTMLEHHIQYSNATLQRHNFPPLEIDHTPTFTREDIITLLKDNLPPWSCQRVNTFGSLQHLKTDLESGQALLVSDGSYFPLLTKAGAAWIIASKDCTSFITGGGAVHSHDSYRSEICGLVGLSAATQCLLPLLTIVPSTLTIACDGEKAIAQLHKLNFEFKTKYNHSDVVTLLIQIWRKMPFPPSPTHVYGHQDNVYGPRTALEHLNIMVDIRAKIFARGFLVLEEISVWNTAGFGIVKQGSTLITGKHKQVLYDKLCHDTFMIYLTKKWDLDTNTLNNVDWKTFGKARKLATHTLRIFVSKWLVGHLPTGQVMKNRKVRKHAKCPHCQTDPETLLHLTTCPSPTVRQYWISALENLQKWLTTQETDPHIASFLLQGILSWTRDPYGEEVPLFQYPSSYLSPFCSQLTIGWFGTISGLIHNSIISRQTKYYQSISRRKTGPSWGKKLTLELWHIIYKLWTTRNTKLHEATIHENHGASNLHFSIQVEHHLGPLGLPTEYNGYFQIPLPELLQKNIEYKKRWFNTIRRAREIRQLAAPDSFTINTTLRRWVHLPKTPA